jgi:molybdenum cofactor cytidylyltransferase
MVAFGEKVKISNCGAVILAAGQSSRMSTPKQLLRYKGKTLLQHAIDTCKQAGIGPVVVVLGSNGESILKQTDTGDTHIVQNENWPTGMASSITAGINALVNIYPSTDAAILMVCDQPYVEPSLLIELITAQRKTGKSIVACEYEDAVGVPALFHESFFARLSALEGDAGARGLIRQYPDNVVKISFPKGSIDVDTLDVYENLK